jgi:hypothetical protein
MEKDASQDAGNKHHDHCMYDFVERYMTELFNTQDEN